MYLYKYNSVKLFIHIEKKIFRRGFEKKQVVSTNFCAEINAHKQPMGQMFLGHVRFSEQEQLKYSALTIVLLYMTMFKTYAQDL